MRMVFGHRTARTHARAHPRREIVAQREELRGRVRPQHALARMQERPLGVCQQLGGLLDPRRIARAHVRHSIMRRRVDWRFVRLDFRPQQLVRDGDEDGTLPPGQRGPKSGAHHLGQSLRLTDERAVLCNWPRHLDEVRRLPRAAPLRVRGEAAARTRDGDDRMSLRVRAGQSRQHVRPARSRTANDHARLAADARISLRQMHRAFFVSAVDMPDAITRRL